MGVNAEAGATNTGSNAKTSTKNDSIDDSSVPRPTLNSKALETSPRFKIRRNEPEPDPEPTPQTGYKILNREALRAIGNRQPVFLFDGFIEQNTANLVVGQFGTGKSFYAVHIAATVSQEHNVLYIAAEGERGIAKRVQVWEYHNKKTADKLFVIGQVVDLKERWADIIAAIETVRPELIIWDTLSRHLGIIQLDENISAEYGIFHGYLDKLRNEYSCTHLVIHHEGKNGEGARGSSSIEQNMDAVDRLQKDGQLKNVVRVIPRKRKDDDMPAEQAFELRVYETGNRDDITGELILDMHGKPQTSCVLEPTTLADKGNMSPETLRQIVNAIATGHNTPEKIKNATGISERSVTNALKELVDDEKISKEGKTRNVKYFIA